MSKQKTATSGAKVRKTFVNVLIHIFLAIFINGFLILKRILDIQYETESTKMVEMIQVKIAIISVFMNILGKFRILVSVNSLT